ncbi:MAG: hypothetical protein MUF15_08665 [Acidobacteria bacterium]|jgi:valyl-tRNA synthetase|nr:hypothetical protein [Acidobacteriota bacterium]
MTKTSHGRTRTYTVKHEKSRREERRKEEKNFFLVKLGAFVPWWQSFLFLKIALKTLKIATDKHGQNTDVLSTYFSSFIILHSSFKSHHSPITSS